MTRSITLSVLLALTVFAVPAQADARVRPGMLSRQSLTMRAAMAIERRMDRQTRAIFQGALEGSLTWDEVATLTAHQGRIARTLEASLADGTLRFEERRRLERMQDREARRIRRLLSNHRARRPLPNFRGTSLEPGFEGAPVRVIESAPPPHHKARRGWRGRSATFSSYGF